MDEKGQKEVMFEAYYSHMLPLLDVAKAFSFNATDGYCIKIERELVEAYNICFETKKLRDIAMITMYND
jgi:hypothetical protein